MLVMDWAYQKKGGGEGIKENKPGVFTAKLNRAAFMLCDIFKPLALST